MQYQNGTDEIRYIQKAGNLTMVYVCSYCEWLCDTRTSKTVHPILLKSNPRYIDLAHLWVVNEIERSCYEIYENRKTPKEIWLNCKNLLLDIYGLYKTPEQVKKMLNKCFGYGLITCLEDFLPYYPEWIAVKGS
jgi:hypothetical protein